MGHRAGVLDQRLDPTERLGEDEDPRGRAQRLRRGAAAQRKKKPKPIVATLRKKTTAIKAGRSVHVHVRVPSSITRRHHGASVRVKVVITAVDGAGNTSRVTARRTTKVGKPKARKRRAAR